MIFLQILVLFGFFIFLWYNFSIFPVYVYKNPSYTSLNITIALLSPCFRVRWYHQAWLWDILVQYGSYAWRLLTSRWESGTGHYFAEFCGDSPLRCSTYCRDIIHNRRILLYIFRMRYREDQQMKNHHQVEYRGYFRRLLFLYTRQTRRLHLILNMISSFQTYILTPILFLLSSQAFAAGDFDPPTSVLPQPSLWPGEVVASIISFGISATAVLAVIAITWWAIQMILASGEEEKIKKWRKMIIFAFVGLIVAGLAYGVVKIITNLQF